MKVFIADDSALVRERLAALLSEIKAIELIGQAGDVSGTLEGIRQLEPDVVILDIRIPGGTGFHVLEAVKQLKVAPMIIVLTAFPYPQYRKRCREAGAAFFFDKATEFDRVVQVLTRLQDGVVDTPAITPQ